MYTDAGKYFFDPDRNIIFQKNILETDYKAICDRIAPSGHYLANLQLLNSIAYMRRNMEDKAIKKAGIILTYNCNLRCNYCSQSSEEGSQKEIDVEDIEAFAKEIIKKQIISNIVHKEKKKVHFYFTGGGEPTYSWSTFIQSINIIRRICDENDIELLLELATNGMLTLEQCQFVAQNFQNIMVSYDGMPKTQNTNRKSARPPHLTSNQVEQTIRYFLGKGLNVTVRSTIWQNDLYLLPEMLLYLKENFNDIVSWEINPVTPAGRAVSIMKHSSKYKNSNFVHSYLNILQTAQKIKCRFNIMSPILSVSPCGFMCGGAGSNPIGAWLFPDGRISTCSDSSEIMTQIGNIKNGKVEWIENYKDPLFEMGYQKFISCRSCVAFPVCGGGCPLKHIREQRDQTGMLEWECSMLRSLFTYILEKTTTGENLFGWYAQELDFLSNKNVKIWQLNYSNSEE